MNRELTDNETKLLSWLLEHGNEDAKLFLASIEQVRVISECPCGCASIDFAINGKIPPKAAGLEVISDFLWTSKTGAENGVFVSSKDNQLSGLEVWSRSLVSRWD